MKGEVMNNLKSIFRNLLVVGISFGLFVACEKHKSIDSTGDEMSDQSSESPTKIEQLDIGKELANDMHHKTDFKVKAGDKHHQANKGHDAVKNDADFVWHKVKRGEWLAKILREKNLNPIWGKGNYADQVVELNPEVFKNGLKATELEPGTKIKLPAQKH